ncbi:MAG TPA: chitobiase/beta-hexosaminidase C-terminal domain-containing protein, partial [Fibrobacteria bacterium]|nr:chitobiase/beta-hexosaminidase C-terminal domain-containing protein [Fibrobacteria bacterium]
QWKTVVDLSNPGELTRIHVKAWDHLGNTTDSVLLVSRDPIPGQLPPSLSWKSPEKSTGTVVPFSQAKFLVQVVLTDISGIDAPSVRINGSPATAVNDSVWELSVDLPPNGQPQTITLEAKNKRGVPTSGFVSVARAKDEEKPTASRLAGTQDKSVLFAVSSLDVGWTARDNDKISQAWIQDSLVDSDASGFQRNVPLVVGTQWIKFRAVDPAGNEVRDSVSVERRMDTVKAVTFSDTNGKLRSGSFWVKLSCATPGATIRYTLDGSEPMSTSPIYGDSLKVDTTLTLKARAFAAGRLDGPVATQAYLLAVPVKVFAGLYHTLVVMSDSSLWGYGSGNCNSVGGSSGCIPTDAGQKIPQKLAERVVEAEAGENRSFWITSDGNLWVQGENYQGSLGIGSNDPALVPTLVARGVAKVRAFENLSGSRSLFVLKKDGSLWGAGYNAAGQIGAGSIISTNQLVKITDSVLDVGGGANFGFFLKQSGALWGSGRFAPLGVDSKIPVRIMDSIALIPGRFVQSLILVKKNGKVLAGGENQEGQLGLGHQSQVAGMVELTALQGRGIKQLALGEVHSLVLLEDGELLAMGKNSYGVFTGDLKVDRYISPQTIHQGANNVGCGLWFSTILRQDHVLMSYGANDGGQLGGGVYSTDPQLVRVRF